MTNLEKAQKLVSITLSIYHEYADNALFGDVDDWTFVVRHCGKNIFGLCSYKDQEIILDPRVMEHGTWDEIKEIVLHECAHALAGIELGKKNVMAHGKLWRTWAVRLGCNPRARATFGTELMEHYKPSSTRKYHIISIINDEVTIHGGAGRKLKNLDRRHYPHVANSLGNLYLIDCATFQKLNDIEEIKKNAFR